MLEIGGVSRNFSGAHIANTGDYRREVLSIFLKRTG